MLSRMRFPNERRDNAQANGVGLFSVMKRLRISSRASREYSASASPTATTAFCSTSIWLILIKPERIVKYRVRFIDAENGEEANNYTLKNVTLQLVIEEADTEVETRTFYRLSRNSRINPSLLTKG